MTYIIVIVIGFLTAYIGSIAGLGGGIILVPSLLFLHNINTSFSWATPQTIVGVSLIVMFFTGISSTYSYYKNKRVDIKSGFIFLSGSIPGALIGTYLSQFIAEKTFTLYFGILMIVISLVFFLRKFLPQQGIKSSILTINSSVVIDKQKYEYQYGFLPAFILTVFVGMASGLFGIGGGSLMVPIMILLFGFPAHIATATSMFMIFISSSISSAAHIALGHVEWDYTLFFIPGALIGGTLGAKTNQYLKGNIVEWILRILLILIGIRLIWEGLL